MIVYRFKISENGLTREEFDMKRDDNLYVCDIGEVSSACVENSMVLYDSMYSLCDDIEIAKMRFDCDIHRRLHKLEKIAIRAFENNNDVSYDKVNDLINQNKALLDHLEKSDREREEMEW